ncbi:MAG: cyclic pyranopterin monophosphate synthase MoaC [Gemmatimonadota bacterium]
MADRVADSTFPHLDAMGRARMVDVGGKPISRRRACAEGLIRMQAETLSAILGREIEKGDVFAVARLAAIGGAKQTAMVVPLCHPLPLEAVEVRIEAERGLPGLRLTVEASAEARTGVEMEALSGVSAGLLAVYDMCKAVDRAMELGPIRLLSKEGGTSGTWLRDPAQRPAQAGAAQASPGSARGQGRG